MKEIIEGIREIIEEAERMKAAYFFHPDQTAGGRRSYEKRHSHDVITWKDGKDVFTAEFKVSCSCRNVYAYGIYTRNGQKTTLTAIKNSLKRLEDSQAAK